MHRNTFLLYKLFLSSGLDRCLIMTPDTEITCKSVFGFNYANITLGASLSTAEVNFCF